MSETARAHSFTRIAGFCLVLILGMVQAARATTLMILVDWWGYQQMDTVLNLRVNQPASEIFYKGGTPPNPVPSDAFTSEKRSWWYALPGFQADDYRQGRIRFNIVYNRGWYQNDSMHKVGSDTTLTLPDTQTVYHFYPPGSNVDSAIALGSSLPKTVNLPAGSIFRGPKLYSAAANGGTEILNIRGTKVVGSILATVPGNIDSCIATLASDTVWIRWGTPANPPGQQPLGKSMRCLDHNPFDSTRAKVAVFSPWTHAKASVVVNGIPESLRSGPLPGWFQTDIWTLPSDTSTPRLKLRFELADGDIRELDSAGGAYHAVPGAAVNFIQPAMGTLPGFNQTGLTDSVVFAWTNPWRSRLAELYFGGREGIRGTWQPGGWYAAKVWGRPATAALRSTTGDSGTIPVNVPPATLGRIDTIWLTPKPAGSFKIRMDGTAYDYRLGNRGMAPIAFGIKDTAAYFPFSQTTNTDLITGMVQARLDPNGRLRATTRPICGSTISDTLVECRDQANAPDKWFGPVFRGSRPMNAIVPASLEISKIVDGSFAFEDTLYFPLDTLVRLPGTSQPNPFNDSSKGADSRLHNFGYCIELHGQAEIVPGAALTVKSDDDMWIFLDSNLVVDLGGQHGFMQQTLFLDRLPRPVPAAVALDIFHCDRHIDQSGLALSMNFPVHPVGTMKIGPRTPVARKARSATRELSLRSHGTTISVAAPAGDSWVLELRAPDGRLVRSVAGSGSAEVTQVGGGIVFARLASGTESVQKTLFAP